MMKLSQELLIHYKVTEANAMYLFTSHFIHSIVKSIAGANYNFTTCSLNMICNKLIYEFNGVDIT